MFQDQAKISFIFFYFVNIKSMTVVEKKGKWLDVLPSNPYSVFQVISCLSIQYQGKLFITGCTVYAISNNFSFVK